MPCHCVKLQKYSESNLLRSRLLSIQAVSSWIKVPLRNSLFCHVVFLHCKKDGVDDAIYIHTLFFPIPFIWCYSGLVESNESITWIQTREYSEKSQQIRAFVSHLPSWTITVTLPLICHRFVWIIHPAVTGWYQCDMANRGAKRASFKHVRTFASVVWLKRTAMAWLLLFPIRAQLQPEPTAESTL